MNKKRIKAVIYVGTVAMLFLAGCSPLQDTAQDGSALEFEQQQALQWEQTVNSEAEKMLKVFVCGAVVTPGVVELPADSRVQDALEAADGFADDASRDYLNLARPLTDGEKIYFPTAAEADALLEQEALERSGLVDINTADESRLCTLPGIGESRAADIIRYREENGPFSAVEELQEVDCITENIYDKLADRITVGY